MATIDEIKRLKSAGKSEGEIVTELKKKGISEKEIVDTMVQNNIKAAVSEDAEQGGAQDSQEMEMPEMPLPPGQQDYGQEMSMQSPQQAQEVGASGGGYSQQQGSGEYSGMQQSMVTQEQPMPEQDYSQEQLSLPQEAGAYQDAYGGGAYQQYQPYQEAMSSDVITEISEQVVSEKLSVLQDKLEKVIDMKNVFEARTSNLNERLRRMEKIIDQIQISILQKVGEYAIGVEDVKKELEETQKSFKVLHNDRSLKPKKKKH
ncbi:MAG: hypothetical protein KJ600_02315 [Nanoarchaeota archaeon]|nr:hypothetical protein [Nanoarchaeota archaeon]MBU1103369.1 hypothetical protein [Nanoarchaeota archaeon]